MLLASILAARSPPPRTVFPVQSIRSCFSPHVNRNGTRKVICWVSVQQNRPATTKPARRQHTSAYLRTHRQLSYAELTSLLASSAENIWLETASMHHQRGHLNKTEDNIIGTPRGNAIGDANDIHAMVHALPNNIV